jgi:hypothetical protein
MDVMKTELQPSDREVLAGLVERVTYQNAENGLCVIRGKARGHRDLVTVVGHAAVISAGEWISVDGCEQSSVGQRFPLDDGLQETQATKVLSRVTPESLFRVI